MAENQIYYKNPEHTYIEYTCPNNKTTHKADINIFKDIYESKDISAISIKCPCGSFHNFGEIIRNKYLLDFTTGVSRLSEHQYKILQREFEQKKKSVGIAYLLLFLIGIVGAHARYFKRKNVVTLYNVILFIVLPGCIFFDIVITLEGGGPILTLLCLGMIGLSNFCCIFLIPSWAETENDKIRKQILVNLLKQNTKEESKTKEAPEPEKQVEVQPQKITPAEELAQSLKEMTPEQIQALTIVAKQMKKG